MKKAVGLMGLLGMYSPNPPTDVRAALTGLEKLSFDYVDTAEIYSRHAAPSKHLQRLFKGRANCIQEKIGANLDNDSGSLVQLIDETERLVSHYGELLFSILVHRPTRNSVDRDVRYLEWLKSTHPHLSSGICTNDLSVLSVIGQAVQFDYLQAAVNLLDFKRVEPLIIYCRERGIIVQARSVLAGSLLSGMRSIEEVRSFSDPIRSRYSETLASTAIFERRLSKVRLIKDYYDSQFSILGDYNGFSQFCYAATAALLINGDIVAGGSVISQIESNLAYQPVPEIFKTELAEKVDKWAAEYI